MIKKGKFCYRCGEVATSEEHVPPKGLFPEKKDINYDFRKNLITVPSCEKHNSKKSVDDEFLLISLAGSVRGNLVGYFHYKTKGKRAILRKHENFFNQILKDSNNINLVDKNGNIIRAIIGETNINRLNSCFESIAFGLYYAEYDKIFKGKVKVANGFSEIASKNHDSFLKLLDYSFENDKSKRAIKGENKEVFYYQFTDPDKFGLISLRICFYGGLFVYIAFMPEDANEPYDLAIDLANRGIKTIFKLGDSEVEFN